MSKSLLPANGQIQALCGDEETLSNRPFNANVDELHQELLSKDETIQVRNPWSYFLKLRQSR